MYVVVVATSMMSTEDQKWTTTLSDIDHLNSETKVLPVHVHNEMLEKQYLAACHKHGHP